MPDGHSRAEHYPGPLHNPPVRGGECAASRPHPRTTRSCSTISTTWSSRPRRRRSACGCSSSPKSCSSAGCSWRTWCIAGPTRQRSRKRATTSQVWGAFNTAVLIFSSLTMALAVRAAQTSEPPETQVGWLVATMFLGLVFLGVKVIEYREKFRAPSSLARTSSGRRWEHPSGAEIFYSLYFCMTGLHALHMIIGIGHHGRHYGDGMARTRSTPTTTRRSRCPVSTGTSSTSSGSSCSRCCTSSAALRRARVEGSCLLATSLPKSLYYVIFLALMVGTGLTVVVAFFDFGFMNNVVMLTDRVREGPARHPLLHARAMEPPAHLGRRRLWILLAADHVLHHDVRLPDARVDARFAAIGVGVKAQGSWAQGGIPSAFVT